MVFSNIISFLLRHIIAIDKRVLEDLSEVGFEPTPTEVDCDLNAAP